MPLAIEGHRRGVIPDVSNFVKRRWQMPKFTTRVELHDADDDGDDYKTLHKAMRAEGFSRFITNSTGKKFRLPTAEYNRTADITKQQVLASAKQAAATTGRSASILVTESNGRVWENLPPVV
jgi:hypothetical protein